MKTIKGLILIFLVILLITYFAYSGPTKTTQLRWKFKTKGWTSKIYIDDSSVYFGDRKYLYSLNKRTGQKNWQFVTNGQVAKIIVGEDSVFLRVSNKLISLNKKSGNKKWLYTTRSEVDSGQEPVFQDPYEFDFKVTKKSVFLVDKGKVVSLNEVNGKERWRFRAKQWGNSNYPDISSSSPLSITSKGVSYFVGKLTYVLEKHTGEKLKLIKRNIPFENYKMDDRLAYRLTIEQREPDTDTEIFHVVDTKTGKEIRNFTSHGYDESSEQDILNLETLNGIAYVDGDDILGGDTDAVLKAVDLKTGKQKWRFKPSLVNRNNLSISSIKIANGLVYIGIDNLTLNYDEEDFILAAVDARTGKQKWQFTGNNFYLNSIKGGTLFINEYKILEQDVPDTVEIIQALSAFDSKTGRQKWRFPIKEDSSITSPIEVSDGAVYFAAGNQDETEDPSSQTGYVYAAKL